MKARTLFIGSFCLSLAIHTFILFIPSWSIPKPAGQRETYRVELIRRPFKAAGYEEPETTPVSTVIQEKPKPREDPAKPRTAVKKAGHDQSIRESEKTSTAASQPQEELRTVNNAHQTNSWSPGAPRSSIQFQHTDYQRILSELSQLLHERLRYPEVARRKGIEGSVAVTLTLNTTGTATDVIISESSGSSILDRAAVRAISDIFPYPDPPDTPLRFTIPVTYRLAGPK